MFAQAPAAVRHVPSPEAQLAFAAEYLYMCTQHPGATPETLQCHLLDTVVVPCLRPESSRAMLPCVAGLDTPADAITRLSELALLLAELCPADAAEPTAPLQEAPMKQLDTARACLRWIDANYKLGPPASKPSLKKMLKRVAQLFQRGPELAREFERSRGSPGSPGSQVWLAVVCGRID